MLVSPASKLGENAGHCQRLVAAGGFFYAGAALPFYAGAALPFYAGAALAFYAGAALAFHAGAALPFYAGAACILAGLARLD
jgi:hypothetical protein